ncbi:unnamed protein product [Medioppia subpectinata]|uniref:Uncharacterized protein n=1 Tax=Medioppia subpectinata TaxID=1979941 RepID=A0A7R9KVS9_9ACAR|nr:unnamed protein product [Medioppia subpectinata]CAG2110776.1 unnamed protein product [Medioppia subpectinata]
MHTWNWHNGDTFYRFNCSYKLDTPGEAFINLTYSLGNSTFYTLKSDGTYTVTPVAGVEGVTYVKGAEITISKWKQGNYNCTVKSLYPGGKSTAYKSVYLNSGHNMANNVFITAAFVALSTAFVIKSNGRVMAIAYTAYSNAKLMISPSTLGLEYLIISPYKKTTMTPVAGVDGVTYVKGAEITISKWKQGNYNCTVRSSMPGGFATVRTSVYLNTGHNMANNVFITAALVALSTAIKC